MAKTPLLANATPAHRHLHIGIGIGIGNSDSFAITTGMEFGAAGIGTWAQAQRHRHIEAGPQTPPLAKMWNCHRQIGGVGIGTATNAINVKRGGGIGIGST